jgi:hypothetical protein
MENQLDGTKSSAKRRAPDLENKNQVRDQGTVQLDPILLSKVGLRLLGHGTGGPWQIHAPPWPALPGMGPNPTRAESSSCCPLWYIKNQMHI